MTDNQIAAAASDSPGVSGTPPFEYSRYTETTSKEGSEFLIRNKGSFEWAEGPGFGRPVDASLGQLLMKPTLRITWYNVPRAFIYNSTFVPTNIRFVEGRVNSDTFLGRAPGTLLCLEATIDAHEMPIDPALLGLTGGEPAREYNVIFNLKEFAPPSGSPNGFQGHNLLPYGGSVASPGNPAIPGNSVWYLVSVDGSTTGLRQYQSTPFATLFEGVLF